MPVSHLYIHIPFCASRCSYCDFFSTSGRLELAPDYVDALLEELDSCRLGDGTLETVYIGGGTPTLIASGLLARVLQPLLEKLTPGAEVTIEANPDTVSAGLAGRLAAGGVNRVSLGVQSFDARLRRNLGRGGPAEAVVSAVEQLRGAGLQNIGLDLIFGIPGQDADGLERDLRQALALKPEHISCYELSIKAGSEFERRWAGEIEAAKQHGPDFYRQVVDTLEAAGYQWYETSNFAFPGRECRHNLAYWRAEDYLGIGAGAWSTVGRERWRNVEDVEAYIAGWQGLPDHSGKQSPSRLHEHLTPREKMTEKLALGLRLQGGVDRAGVAGLLDAGEESILCERGYLTSEGGKILLTRAGRFVANEICARLLRD